MNLWEDICFYYVYQDKILYEDYLNYLTFKYNTDINSIIKEISKVEKKAQENIKKHHYAERDCDLLFKTESREEKVRTVIELNRKKEESKKELFNNHSKANIRIKKIQLLKNIN